jgi:hypothetical protein
MTNKDSIIPLEEIQSRILILWGHDKTSERTSQAQSKSVSS